MHTCIIPFEYYADAVARARTAAAKRGLIAQLPVVVTTDTQDEGDFRQIQALGWHRVDHAKYKTAELWGPFGPALVDAAILAHADEFVGSLRSTMSKIAASRQRSWYNRETLYTFKGARNAKLRRRWVESLEMDDLDDEDVRVFY
jgi:hypothetical protein